MASLIKFSPVVLLAILVISGMDLVVAAPISMFVAAFICKFMERISFREIMDVAMEGAKDAVTLAFILMFAYALAELFIATGVGASAISLFLHVGVTGKSVAAVSLLASAVLATATGTSWGTYAACIPIFLWLTSVVGGDPALTCGAVVGGAAFGDNIGLISDTTILSSQLQDVKVVDRVRVQWPWSLICLFSAAAVFYAVGLSMDLPGTTGDPSQILSSMTDATLRVLEEERPSVLALLDQVQNGTPFYMLIPVVLVIGMAIARADTITCLASGVLSSVLLGFVSGSLASVSSAVDLIYAGFSDAGSWIVIMVFWTIAFGAVMRRMDAFRDLSDLIVKMSTRVRHLLVHHGFLTFLGNAALNEELAAIATVGPVIKEIINENVEGSEEDLYKLRNRNALFNDAIAVHTAGLIPWHPGAIYYVGLASQVYPLYEFAYRHMFYNFLSVITMVSLVLLTLTRWDRFIPLFAIPSEPDVRLKSLN